MTYVKGDTLTLEELYHEVKGSADGDLRPLGGSASIYVQHDDYDPIPITEIDVTAPDTITLSVRDFPQGPTYVAVRDLIEYVLMATTITEARDRAMEAANAVDYTPETSVTPLPTEAEALASITEAIVDERRLSHVIAQNRMRALEVARMRVKRVCDEVPSTKSVFGVLANPLAAAAADRNAMILETARFILGIDTRLDNPQEDDTDDDAKR